MKIDELIIRLQKSVDKQDRHVCRYRDDNRCNKSVLIDRLSIKLINRYFKLLINGKIHYALFVKSSIKSNNQIWYNGGFSFVLGYSDSEYRLLFMNHQLEYESMKLHYNDLLDLEYEEITSDKFMNVVKLFTSQI